MVDLAVQLIGKKSGAFKPENFQDHYATALRELVQQKLKGRKIIAPSEDARPKGSNVVDLMEALRRSVGSGEKSVAKPKAKTTPKSSKKKSA
jgi:DNA end-binding protein Ku